MNLEEIKRIIVDQGEEMNEIFERERIIGRDIPRDELMKFIEHSNILAILGVRRSGKSIFSHLLLQGKKFGYVNFDDERFAGLEAENLNNVLQAFYELYGTDLEYLILDEIQNIPGWELFANRMRRTKKVIITGSNARLLSGELATHLTGRGRYLRRICFRIRRHANSFSVKNFLSATPTNKLLYHFSYSQRYQWGKDGEAGQSPFQSTRCFFPSFATHPMDCEKITELSSEKWF